MKLIVELLKKEDRQTKHFLNAPLTRVYFSILFELLNPSYLLNLMEEIKNRKCF